MTPRKLFSRRDAAVLLSLLALAALFFLLLRLRPAGVTAVVALKDRELLRRDLSAVSGEEIYRFSGEEGLEITVSLRPEGARIVSSGCRDQVCVGTGLLTRAGDAAVCLPAGLSLRLLGEGGADAVTY